MDSKRSIFIIHFHPIERYPPILNMISFITDHTNDRVTVVSMKDSKDSKLTRYVNNNPRCTISRIGIYKTRGILRLSQYALFYYSTLLLLLKKKPGCVLYYETISGWPALIYKKIKGKQVKLAAHYHEYVSLPHYANGMRLVRWMHEMEKKMYKKSFYLLSHTNDIRMAKFRADHYLEAVSESLFYTLPNYPSVKWERPHTPGRPGQKIKLVFVGSLGLDDTYIQQLCTWVLRHKELFSLYIYAYNLNEGAKKLLSDVAGNNIYFQGACDYYNLQHILPLYDVGLVIYKPASENMIYNASNKVFEYLACNLDVWFSSDILYSHEYIRMNVYPKVLAVDFSNLENFDYEAALNRSGLEFRQSDYFYENEYKKYYKKLTA